MEEGKKKIKKKKIIKKIACPKGTLCERMCEGGCSAEFFFSGGIRRALCSLVQPFSTEYVNVFCAMLMVSYHTYLAEIAPRKLDCYMLLLLVI